MPSQQPSTSKVRTIRIVPMPRLGRGATPSVRRLVLHRGNCPVIPGASQHSLAHLPLSHCEEAASRRLRFWQVPLLSGLPGPKHANSYCGNEPQPVLANSPGPEAIVPPLAWPIGRPLPGRGTVDRGKRKQPTNLVLKGFRCVWSKLRDSRNASMALPIPTVQIEVRS